MRRMFEVGALAILLVAACGGGKADKDPSYREALPTMEDVDDSLADKVQGDRVRVSYEADDPIKGAAEPLVTIVEYSDLQCPFCGTLAQTLDELVKAYPEDVRLVFHHFPLPMHPDAELGARATLAAQRQGHFWAMHDRLFKNHTAMKREDLLDHAKALGLDVDKFSADLDDPKIAEQIERDRAIGRRLGVRGTPTFFINGLRHSGAVAGEQLRELIDTEREHARALIEAGSKREEVYARIMRAARPTGTNPGAGKHPTRPQPAAPEAAAQAAPED